MNPNTPEKIVIYFASNVKFLRKKINLPQEHVAQRLNLKRSTYSAYENGACEPNLETLVSICQYFNRSIDEMVKTDLSKRNIN